MNNAGKFFYQYTGQKEMDGQDFVVELVLPITKDEVSIENANNVERNFTFLEHILTEKVEETKGVFVVTNAK